MKLYLMRHGEAASEQIDPQQGLSAHGRAGIENLATRLAGQDIQFAQIFHSDKTRAKQTAEIMGRILAPGLMPEQRSGLKPNDDPHKLIAEIESWQQDTLICSHLPFVPSLIVQLSGQPQGMGFVPGTIVCLEKENHVWKINWMETP